MNNKFTYKGIEFEIANYNARKNEFEHGLKYQLFVGGYPTSYKFSTKHNLKEYAKQYYWLWL